MKARVCFFEGNIRKVKQFDDVDDFTDYLDSLCHYKYAFLHKYLMSMLSDLVSGRRFTKIENEFMKVAYYLDINCKDELKFNFFIRIK